LFLDFPSRWLTDGEFDNVEKIKRIETLFLFLPREKDAKVHYRDDGEIIYENSPQPKSLILLVNTEHNNIPSAMEEDQYLSRLREWIEFSRGN